MRKYFKSIEQIKRKQTSRTRKQQAAARELKERILSSPEGRKALAELEAAEFVSTKFAMDYSIRH